MSLRIFSLVIDLEGSLLDSFISQLNVEGVDNHCRSDRRRSLVIILGFTGQ
jgi:hypothetical protein